MKIFSFSLNIERITDETDLEKVVESVIKEEVARLKEIPPEDLKSAITLIGHRDIMDGEREYLEKEKITIDQFLGRHGFSVDRDIVDENPWVSDQFLTSIDFGEFIHSKLTVSNRAGGSFEIFVTTNPIADPTLIFEYVSVLSKFYELCNRDFDTWHAQTNIKDLELAEHRFEWIKYNADGMKKFLGDKWYYEFIHGIDMSADWPRT